MLCSGISNGPIHYNITPIQKKVVNLTIDVSKEENQLSQRQLKEYRKVLETDNKSNLNQLIAGVQN